MRNTFVDCLMEKARKDDRIFLITPDMGYSVLEGFREEFPDRFLNTGIAEQNTIGVAAGLALSGKVVYVYSIIPFITMRCFEQVRVDVAYIRTNVRLVGVGAGLTYGPAGATHHAIEDIAIMRALPNMTVCCPGDPIEVKAIINQSFDYDGPMYIRLGKSGEPTVHKKNTDIMIGKAVTIVKGHDLALITTSNMLHQGKMLVEDWKKKDVNIRLISMPTIKPLDTEAIICLIQEKIPIVTLEEHNIIGGLGSAIAEVIADSGYPVKFKRIGIRDVYSHHVGSQEYLRHLYHLNEIDIHEIINRV